MTSLKGKTALVTGASRGIGRASALALASAGAQVLIHTAAVPTRPRRSSPRSVPRAGAPKPLAPTSEHPMVRTSWRPRSAASSATASTYSSPMPASRRLRRSRKRRLPI